MQRERVCEQGHKYIKSSNCPVCPTCQTIIKPNDGLLSKLSAPARRALEQRKIYKVEDLTTFNEQDLMDWHGLGPASIRILKKELALTNLYFKK